MGANGNGGLSFVAKLSIEEAIKNAQKLKKEIASIGAAATTGGSGFDTKPLTEYQKEQLKIKQQALDLAKAKQEQAKADRSASLALQQALKEERLARAAINTQIAKNRLEQQEASKPQKRVTQISNSQAEIDAYKKGQQGSILYTSAIQNERVERAKLNAESAKQAIANGTLVSSNSAAVSSLNNQTAATKAATLSKKQLAQMLAEEKYRQAESTKELKNNAREMLNAKGSIEQRKAALERLIIAYRRLSVAERESASGQRMASIIKGITDQVKDLENQTNSSKSGVSGFFDYLKSSILGTLGPIALLTAAWTGAKAAFAHNVEISDNFVDVQRTAKLSAEQVDILGNQLKKINTRTDLEGLLDIGFEGGRLSVAKEDLVGFIQTVDQLAVVLKKELPGGAEAVAESLGKIVNIYKITQNEWLTLAEAMRKVGSLQLELAHAGGVTVKYLQDFTLGVAGTAVSANIALPVIEAYGAVMSGAGTIASSAAISLTRLVTDLSVKRGKYFAIAQLGDASLTVEKFNNLINTDTNAALLAFFKGLKAGNPTQIEFNDRIRSVGITTGKVMLAVKTLANNQDKLAEKTKLGTKSYEEGTSVAHNFELANNSLAASFDKIKNGFVNAFTSSDFSRRLAELLNGITDNRSEAEKLAEAYQDNKHRSDELEHSLNPLIKRYDELKTKGKLNKVEQEELKNIIVKIGEIMPEAISKFSEYGKALDINRSKVNDLTKAQKDLLELQNRDALKAANKQFDGASAFLPIAKNRYEDAIKARRDFVNKIMDLGGGDSRARVIQKAKDDVTETTKLLYDAAKAVEKLGGKLTEAQKRVIALIDGPKKEKKKQEVLGDGTNSDVDQNVRTIEVIKAEIKALQDSNKKLDVTSKDFKSNIGKIKELKKELKLALGGVDTDQNKFDSVIKSRNNLQGEIDLLTKKGRTKQLTADAQELADIDDKYKKLREKAIAFNNDKKNKGLKVDTGGLLVAQTKEEDALRDKQATEKLKVKLDDQKKLYDEFEQYRSRIGYKSANDLFAKQIGNAQTYYDYLIAKKAELENGDEKAKGGNAGNGEFNRQQIAELDKQIAAEVDARAKRDRDIYANAYQAAETYQQKLQAIDVDYNQKKAALGEKATQDQLSQLQRQRDEAIKSVNSENADRLSGAEELLEKIDSLTRQKAIEALNASIAVYREQYKKGYITAKEYYDKIAPLQGKIDQLIGNNIFNKILSAIKAYRKELKQIVPDLQVIKTAQQEMFSAIGDGANGASSVISELADSLSQLNIGGEELQATLKNVSGVLQGAGELAKGLSSKNPVDIVTGSIKLLTSAINLFNFKDKRLEKQIRGYQAQLESLGKSYKQLERDVSSAVGENIYTDQAAQIENLKQQQAELIKMRDAESSKKKADQNKIKEYQNQIDEIPDKIEDIQKSISQNLIQGTFRDLSNSLADAFVEAFKSGQDGITKMDDALNNFIANAIKNSLKLKILDPVVKNFTDELTDYAKKNNNSIIGFDFEKWKEQIKKAGQLFNDGIKGSEDFFKDINTDALKPNTLTASINQPTAEKLEGLWRGQFDLTKQIQIDIRASSVNMGKLYDIATSNLDMAVKIEANTFRTANNTDLLNTKLDSIIANTKPVKSARD